MKNVTLSFIGMLMSGIVSAQCPPPSAFSTLDINNVSATITNSGDLWWDMMNAGYEAPKGSGPYSKTPMHKRSDLISERLKKI